MLVATPRSSATCATVRVPRLRIMRTASRLNSSVYFFLCFPMVQTPRAYVLRSASGKSGQLHPDPLRQEEKNRPRSAQNRRSRTPLTNEGPHSGARALPGRSSERKRHHGKDRQKQGFPPRPTSEGSVGNGQALPESHRVDDR